MTTNKTNTPAPVIREINEHGENIVRVPMRSQKGKWVVLDAPDFDRLELLGISGNWFESDNGSGLGYVRVAANGLVGHQLTVSRLILEAQGGQTVQYHSSDRLDLRRRNISLTKGAAKRDDRKLWVERNYDDFAEAAE